MHFPVSLRSLTSGGLPYLLLFSANSLPPAKNVDKCTGTFPEARRFNMALREVPMVCEGE